MHASLKTTARGGILTAAVVSLALALGGPAVGTATDSPAGGELNAATAPVGRTPCVTTAYADRPAHPAYVRLYQIRDSMLGHHRWFRQVSHGVAVAGGWWGRHRDLVTGQFTVDDCRVAAGELNVTAPRIGVAAAKSAARAVGPGRVLATGLMALPTHGASRLAWAVTTADDRGARTSYIDAVDARVLKTAVVSRAARSQKYTSGTGRVFDPNPVVMLQDQALRDHDDAADAIPPSAYSDARIKRLEGDGHTLVGKYATIVNRDRASSATVTYDYDRSSDYFEQVMAYYAVDAAAHYLCILTHGCRALESQDIAADTFANSFYVPGADVIEMGSRGVDDAEDLEATWHEYGHAFQERQVPDWGQTYQGRAIGEGFSDFLAVALSQLTTTGPVTATTPAACVMDWDATSSTVDEPHCVRRTDTDKTWTGTPDGDPHADGEIWSGALFDLYQAIGRDMTMQIVAEAQYWMNPRTDFEDAAEIIISVAQRLYPVALPPRRDVLPAALATEIFAARGFISR